MEAFLTNCLKTNAQRGSTWHHAMLNALAAPKMYKRSRAVIREADPDTRNLSIQSGHTAPEAALAAFLQAEKAEETKPEA